MKTPSPSTHPQAAPNLHEAPRSAEHKGRHPEESLQLGCPGAPLTPTVGKKNTMEVNGAPEQLRLRSRCILSMSVMPCPALMSPLNIIF